MTPSMMAVLVHPSRHCLPPLHQRLHTEEGPGSGGGQTPDSTATNANSLYHNPNVSAVAVRWSPSRWYASNRAYA